ncbi:hypothetical protein [Streptomyces flaveolus]|uniref:hypothetical protein n=1 Tax=Streptomyces flaveolus TaxID=67297 RepID=UPI0036F63CB1
MPDTLGITIPSQICDAGPGAEQLTLALRQARREAEQLARADTCGLCRRPVAAREGILVRNARGCSEADHSVGQCPPASPRTNDFPQECEKCGGWLELLGARGSCLRQPTRRSGR